MSAVLDVYAPDPGESYAGMVVAFGETLTPCEARRLAEDLLGIADYAERVAGEIAFTPLEDAL